MGISVETFYKYVKKYPDFSDSLKRGKAPVDIEVENALLKRARGFEYEETYFEYKDFPKNKEKAKPTLVRKVKKIIPPNVNACDQRQLLFRTGGN